MISASPRGERALGRSILILLLVVVVVIGGLAFLVGGALIGGEAVKPGLSGTIEIDGSSTVFPITAAVAEEFSIIQPNVRVNVGISGTGGGFKRFVRGEIPIADASRPIKPSEDAQAKANNIEYVEFKVALDGLAVAVNKANIFVDYLTVEELRRIWEPNSPVDSWDDIRPGWPSWPLRLYGPGTDSGTFDYFTEAIVGREDASRPDYTASENDNVLIQGVAGDKYALGYFGYAYYKENKDKLKIVPIDAGSGPVAPTDETVKNGQYNPLSRPLFIYVNKAALEKAHVKAFLEFYMENAAFLVEDVGYTPFDANVYQENLAVIRGGSSS